MSQTGWLIKKEGYNIEVFSSFVDKKTNLFSFDLSKNWSGQKKNSTYLGFKMV